MSFESMQRSIELFVQSNWDVTPIEFPSVPFGNEIDEAYITVWVLDVMTQKISVSAAPSQRARRFHGLMQIDVNVPDRTVGTKLDQALCDEVIDLFDCVQVDGITFVNPQFGHPTLPGWRRTAIVYSIKKDFFG